MKIVKIEKLQKYKKLIKMNIFIKVIRNILKYNKYECIERSANNEYNGE